MPSGPIRLLPADTALAKELAAYYLRNRKFLMDFEPLREDAFFSEEYQRESLAAETRAFQDKTGFRFYITLVEQPHKIIGSIGLNNVVWGAFRSAFLGYKLDEAYINNGYMTAAVKQIVAYAFEELGLHRIEANVMPKNKASLRVLEKCGFVNEGISKYYLNINGVWEDHIHMVTLNYGMHE